MRAGLLCIRAPAWAVQPATPTELHMTQIEKASLFAQLHVRGTPLVLCNAWDAGSAKAIVAAGAAAIATSSWAVAAAQGYDDGENIPAGFVEQIVARIAATIDAPVSVDVEGGYGDDDAALARYISRLLERGVVGINFEDRMVSGTGLHDIDRQAQRIATIRRAAERKNIPLFINARTDLFLGGQADPASLMGDALARANAYAAAGASGFFVPGLRDDALIARLCKDAPLPVNVMVMDGVSPTTRLAALGVARVSYGPIPYIRAMNDLKAAAALLR
ncbi:isocitrate lyase/phosphoenolpyruvate mutase family protein [Rhodanobacter umsongensis]|uniref:Isocitrate lyase/phosphoenolpyruvate mutase family protein n=1 Tax=Rhodanobacter umsongensis TaxID=633153 RepID=A0ABW0JMB1_9GAMM